MDENTLSPIKLARPSRQQQFKIKRRIKPWRWVVMIFSLILITIVTVTISFSLLLKPINTQVAKIKVEPGETLTQIIDKLERAKVFRNAWAIKFYLRWHKLKPKINVGDYKIPPKLANLESVLKVFKEQNRTIDLTFYPGAALNFAHSASDKTPSHRAVLLRAGYTNAQIDAAFAKYRQHELFKLLPEVTNLEGLIFGETYNVYRGASIEDILKKIFDFYLQKIKVNRLVERYQKQGLSLYQGIILASIVEREVLDKTDRRTVAQVFLKRYHQGMKLGSDVTYQYASRLAGTDNNLYIDSPYNTRRVVGLPPTPIASPSLDSLLAVAEPSNTDYLFFVSGDDDRTYFSRTVQEHETFVKRFCHKKCATH